MTEFKKLTPNLKVQDVNKSVDFYRDNLGFELVMTVPEQGTYDWAMMKSGNVEIMFQSVSSLRDRFPGLNDDAGGTTLFIEMANIKKFYDTLKGSHIIIEELHKEFYGMNEFSIQDCNNVIVIFAEKE